MESFVLFTESQEHSNPKGDCQASFFWCLFFYLFGLFYCLFGFFYWYFDQSYGLFFWNVVLSVVLFVLVFFVGEFSGFNFGRSNSFGITLGSLIVV